MALRKNKANFTTILRNFPEDYFRWAIRNFTNWLHYKISSMSFFVLMTCNATMRRTRSYLPAHLGFLHAILLQAYYSSCAIGIIHFANRMRGIQHTQSHAERRDHRFTKRQHDTWST